MTCNFQPVPNSRKGSSSSLFSNICYALLLVLNLLICSCKGAPSQTSAKTTAGPGGTEEEAIKYLQDLEGRYSPACNRLVLANWDYSTNITKESEKRANALRTDYINFDIKIQNETLEKFPNWRDFKNESLRRHFKYFLYLGEEERYEMPISDIKKMSKLRSDMESDYGTITVCKYDNRSDCSLRLDPDLEKFLKTETDPKILSYYWTAWHDKMSEHVPPQKYQKYIDLQTAMARRNGFKNMFDNWMLAYDDESPDFSASGFKQQMLGMWEEFRPMYEKLHAYVRMKIKNKPEYKALIGKCGYIPVYLTGNMWGQDWTHLDAMTKPFPEAPSLDATEAMKKQNYTVMKMFKVSEKFFTDLGLPPMTPTFWEKSMLERPQDGREVVCHASAWDFCSGKGNEDFRIKQCTTVDMRQLLTVHHEMGHIAYYQQYTNQDITFRGGANPGFHEAIGDALALSVRNPQHMQCKLGLELGLDPSICDVADAKAPSSPTKGGKQKVSETDLNYLYYTALSKLAYIPFAISVDSWRWDTFEGKLTPDQYNKRWWELRLKNQGLAPSSMDRMNNTKLFDPAAKYHIIANVEYLRYFVSNILQFQFYEAMCIAAGQYSPNGTLGPLYQCDFDGSKEAGSLLMNMMKLGSSEGWPTALEAITGTRTLSIAPFKHYFQPILDHMEKELEKNVEVPGFGFGWGDCKDV